MNSTTNDTQDTIEYGYCHCGCGQKTRLAPWSSKKQGFIKGKPLRYINGHNGRRPLEERFWEKVNKKGDDDCWEWTGSKRRFGYGQININKIPEKAHRVSWEIHNCPIPDDLHVLHRCDQPSCVNPAHLFLGTHVENMDDMIQKGRDNHPNGSDLSFAKLTEQDIPRIRELYANGMTQTSIGALCGVSKEAISSIITGRTWKHVP